MQNFDLQIKKCYKFKNHYIYFIMKINFYYILIEVNKLLILLLTFLSTFYDFINFSLYDFYMTIKFGGIPDKN